MPTQIPHAQLELSAISVRGIGSYLFPETLYIEPITVLCGKNGSGKSTWLNVLRLLMTANERGWLPFALDEFTSLQEMSYMNAAAFMYGADEIGSFGSPKGDFAGPLGCITLYFDVRDTAGIEQKAAERLSTLRSDSEVIQAAISGIVHANSNVQIRLCHPQHRAPDTATHLKHLIELCIDGELICRFTSELDGKQEFKGGKYPTRSKPYVFEHSARLSLLEPPQTSLNGMKISLRGNELEVSGVAPQHNSVATEFVKHCLALTTRLIELGLGSIFHLSAIRRIDKDYGSFYHPDTLGRNIGHHGERTLQKLSTINALLLNRNIESIKSQLAEATLLLERMREAMGLILKLDKGPGMWIWDGLTDAERDLLATTEEPGVVARVLNDVLARDLRLSSDDQDLLSLVTWNTPSYAQPFFKDLFDRYATLPTDERYLANYLVFEMSFRLVFRMRFGHSVPPIYKRLVDYCSMHLTKLAGSRIHLRERGLNDPDLRTLIERNSSPEPKAWTLVALQSLSEQEELEDWERWGLPISLSSPSLGSNWGRTVSFQLMSSGIEQMLPIIVQASLLKLGETLAIENPEVHLHPEAQTQITEFLFDHARTGRKVIVETQGDLIVRRLLRAVLQEDLPQSAIAVYFVTLEHRRIRNPSHFKASMKRELEPFFGTDRQVDLVAAVDKLDWTIAYSMLQKMEINERGQIANWPDGLLDEDLKESQRLMDALYGGRPEDEED